MRGRAVLKAERSDPSQLELRGSVPAEYEREVLYAQMQSVVLHHPWLRRTSLEEVWEEGNHTRTVCWLGNSEDPAMVTMAMSIPGNVLLPPSHFKSSFRTEVSLVAQLP